MPRPIVLGVVGDSGAGKTTLTRGLVRVLGDGNVAHLSADDYHRYDRRERRSLGISPLHPDANYLDILTQHLGHLRRGNPVLKPVYDHREGTLGRPHYVHPAHYLVVEGLLSFHTEPLRLAHDVRVFLAPPEELRRAWKLKRDCTRRGYTTDQVLWELDHRERDAETFIRPQQAHADIVVSFRRPCDRPPPTSSPAPAGPAAATRPASTPRSCCATRCRTRTSLRSSTTPTTGRASSAASATCCCGSRATSTPTTPRCSRRRCGSG